MKISEIVNRLNLKVVAGADGLGAEVTGGYVSDLLSDVIGHAAEGNIWITLQTHQNIVAVASLKEVAGQWISIPEWVAGTGLLADGATPAKFMTTTAMPRRVRSVSRADASARNCS